MAKLIFSDIDGTLINSKQEVTPKTKLAIRQQIIKGNVFIPVSARMPQAIMTVAGQITKSCSMVAYNGALVLDEMGQPLNSYFMTAAKAAEICTYIESKNNGVVWNVYSGYNWYYFPGNNNRRVRNEEAIVRVKAQPSSIAEVKKLKGVHKILLMGAPELLDATQKDLQGLYPEFYIVKSASNLLEIVVKGVSKGQGARAIAQEFGVDLKDCWAFGDNYNDEKMLEAVGHPVIMGNAPENLKKKFRTTLDNNHDGIALILNQLN
ncbi:Cof-type HAD-IIB family hydrolase [Lactobacillus helsingborgensis]|uniref:Cof-type HAD-IIB family hydrolase n=1 Tax=Lactobacillus helsingborgensis TaxID=1218494 RepID=UPI00226446F3|nr:Cof-type HAD-IIB family hydrolase [Lactobacillus helsingborgensis]UZX31491.1 Cof-type HAD-IIB family hydrolase [Lactobacillus helsingborgensis]